MVLVVWKDMTGASEKVTDKDLLELLKSLRKLSDKVWELGEYEITRERWFRKPVKTKLYSLYLWCPHGEWQIINHLGKSGCSINDLVTREQVGNLILGYRMALENKIKEVQG